MIVQHIIGENSTDSTNIPYILLPVRPLYICKIEEVGSDLPAWLLLHLGGGALDILTEEKLAGNCSGD